MKRKPKQKPGSFFPIAGIGASAGGLEAFLALLEHLPADTGIGFVLIQHLDPLHESALVQLLAKATDMPVEEAENHLRVEPNHVYVIPPNAQMAIADGALKLSAREKGQPQRSIDHFFESLARDRCERAIGVILSGTATDGTLGLEAIRAEGGITFAQDKSARFDSMPNSAIGAKCVDFVLSPAGIANELVRIAKHPWVADRTRAPSAASAARPEADEAGSGKNRPAAFSEALEGGLKKIIQILRTRTGVDFSLYKTSTVRRRINRRMVLNKQGTPEAYVRFLRDNPGEIDALHADMLVSVTDFFRNPEAFDALKTKVFPSLLHRRRESLRIWVPACSTGQEAYSLAMALTEAQGDDGAVPNVHIFATDLNESLLERARGAIYNKALLANLSAHQIRRFFDEHGDSYRVKKGLREMCIFARQNLISDPPFSRLDLISCRNVMIYLDTSLQEKILPSFHHALKPGGFLFLGVSESIGAFDGLFAPVDKKQKIFSRKNGPTPPFRFSSPSSRQAAGSIPAPPPPRRSLPEKWGPEVTAQREADRVTVNQVAPPGVLVNSALQILQFRGDTRAYLTSPSGRATFDVLKMVHEDLMLPLRIALAKARKDMKPRKQSVRTLHDGDLRTVNLEVIPLKNLKEACFLVLFGVETPARPQPGSAAVRAGGAREATRLAEAKRRIGELERELAETRDYNQALQEGHEAANEELQSQSEEVQSANEELQSINEELETSKEELESANEELTTVNEEMANQNTELGRLNNDFNNLQLSIQTAVVVLGRDLGIRRFTPPAEKLFNLRASDLGRPLGAIKANLDCPDLDRLVAEVIDTVSAREREVQDRDGRWHSLRIRPYLTHENKIDGAVLMAVDIDALKRSEHEIASARNFAEAVLRTTHYPFVVLNDDLRVRVANAAFYRTFRVSARETEGRVFYDLGNGQWNIPRLRVFLDEILPRNSFFDDFEITHDFEDIGRRTMLLTARRLNFGEGGEPKGILLAIDDITESARMETVRVSEAHYRNFFEKSLLGILVVDANTQRIADANPAMSALLGHTREEFLKKELWEIGLADDAPTSHALFEALKKNTGIGFQDIPAENKAGELILLSMHGNSYEESDRQVVQLIFQLAPAK